METFLANEKAMIASLLPASQAAKMVGIGTSTFWRHLSAGLLPDPVRLGGRTLWRLDELQAWVIAGCPKQSDWLRHHLNKWSLTNQRLPIRANRLRDLS